MTKTITTFILLYVFLLSPVFSLAADTFDGEPSVKETNSALPLAEPAVSEPVSSEHVQNALGNFPISFELNQGQTDKKVKFLSRAKGYTLFVTANEAVLSLKRAASETSIRNESEVAENRSGEIGTVLRTKFIGANRNPRVEGNDLLDAKTNYIRGKNKKNWQTNVTQYAKTRLYDVYPGIDVIYYGKGQELEYDFIVAPGADPRKIRMQFSGADNLEINAAGDLVLRTKAGEVRHRKPLIYQEVYGERHEIKGGYVKRDHRRVSFEIGSYDRAKLLVIDPVIVYSTFKGDSNQLGFGGDPRANGIAVHKDTAGNQFVYIAGVAINDFEATSNAYQRELNGGAAYEDYPAPDAFVAKFKAEVSGQMSLVYLTFLGGSRTDQARDIALDSEGSAFVVGWTESTNFPIEKAFEAGSDGSRKAFVTKLSSDGSALRYSSYLGGSDFGRFWSGTFGHNIAVDPSGYAYVTGWTHSLNFPTVNALQETKPGVQDYASAFLSKIAPPAGATPATIVYSTYLGGSGPITGRILSLESGSGGSYGRSLVVDTFGNAHVSGYTHSLNFPVKNAAQTTKPAPLGSVAGNEGTVFVSKLNTLASGETSLVYSTYLGGSGVGSSSQVADYDTGIAIDTLGFIYVSGYTYSPDFPTTEGAFQETYGGGSGDSFVAKLNPHNDGNPKIVYSTFLGGKESDLWEHGGGGYESANGLAVDSGGNAYVTGITYSIDFPTKNPVHSFGGGISHSTNGGNKWNALNKGLTDSTISAMAIDTSKSPRTLFAGTRSGVFKSEDGGLNWHAVNNGLTEKNIKTVLVSPAKPSTIYAGTTNGIFSSSDGGGNWNSLNSGLSSQALLAVNTLVADTNTINGTSTDTIYAGTAEGLFKLANGANTWSGTGNTKGVNYIAIDKKTSPHTLYTTSGADGPFRSTDGGVSWNIIVPPFSEYPFLGIAVDESTTPSTLYGLNLSAYTDEGSAYMWKSSDAGQTWQGLARPLTDDVFPGTDLTSLILDSSTMPATIYVGDHWRGVVQIANDGATWTRVFDRGVLSVAIDRLSSIPSPLYVGTSLAESDVFVAKLNPTGSELLFSTHLGGRSHEKALALALDEANNIYVTGHTDSHDFPLVNPHQANHPGPGLRTIFLTKLGNAPLPTSSTESVTTEMAVQTGSLALTVPNIEDSNPGDGVTPTTSVEPLDDAAEANLVVSNNLGAYDIKVNNATIDTNGYYATSCGALPCWEKHGIKIAFSVPTVNDAAVFNNLVISHGEDTDGNPATPLVLVPYDQPLENAGHTYKDFANRRIWVYVPTLSPFVILKGGRDQVNDLVRLTRSFGLDGGIENSLVVKLQNALRAIDSGHHNNRSKACNAMEAFTSHVRAQSGNHLTVNQAAQLLNSARQIGVVLGCG